MIHNKKEAFSYHELSSTMIKLKPEIRKTLVYGTDGEKSLWDGFGWTLANARHLLCNLHMKDNIAAKLQELGIRGETAQIFMTDIFGKTAGSERIRGLIDEASSEALDSAMENLKAKWTSIHSQGQRFVRHELRGFFSRYSRFPLSLNQHIVSTNICENVMFYDELVK